MKPLIAFLGLTLLLGSIPVGAATADADAHRPADPAPRGPGGQPPHDMRPDMHWRRLDRQPPEMETVTFLGVETAPVSKALVAQLNLPNGAGLIVVHVVPDSAAAAALKESDILLKLDDQILIDQRQLAVLVRSHKAGDDVTFTYVRGGKTGTATVRLTTHEVPKPDDEHPWHFSFPGSSPMGRFDLPAADDGDRKHVERVLAMIDRAHRREPVHMEIQADDGRSLHAMSIDTANSTLVFSDDAGSLELSIDHGRKHLVAKNAKGDQLFAGPVTTPQERAAMPPDVRARLEKLESMRNVTFHTDDDFEGGETKVLQADGEQIRFVRPGPGRPVAPAAY